ncbi:hypothetical protein AVEN_24588-1 [Araneus ventricosus]|uniref:Uncharacterized protein n=1 Tax=Araneus ventricosus TaxID=182803 RepID=A0A4Y2FDY2_ARAVE|nr:hypothetical protein AVEN_24588-1 [Araneus ventricosus]
MSATGKTRTSGCTLLKLQGHLNDSSCNSSNTEFGVLIPYHQATARTLPKELRTVTDGGTQSSPLLYPKGSECLLTYWAATHPCTPGASPGRDGKELVKDEPRSGRPPISTTPDNIERVRRMLADDRRLSLRMIAEELKISLDSVSNIIQEHLQKRKKKVYAFPTLRRSSNV